MKSTRKFPRCSSSPANLNQVVMVMFMPSQSHSGGVSVNPYIGDIAERIAISHWKKKEPILRLIRVIIRAITSGSPSLGLPFRSISLSVYRQRRKSDYPQRPLGIAIMKTRLRTRSSSSSCTIDVGCERCKLCLCSSFYLECSYRLQTHTPFAVDLPKLQQ